MTDALGAGRGARRASGRPPALGYRSGYYSQPSSPGSAARAAGAAGPGRTGSRPKPVRTLPALPSRRWRRRWRRCTCRASRPGRSRRPPRSCAATPLGLGHLRHQQRLDESLEACRPLKNPFPTSLLDARCEKVREGGVAGVSQAVLIAIGIDWDGRRQILAVKMANRESRSSWKDFLLRISARRPQRRRVRLVGRRRSRWTALGYPRGPPRDRLPTLLRPLPPQRPRPSAAQGRRRLPAGIALALRPPFIEEACQDPAAWIAKWATRYPKLVGWVEETIEETLTFYRLPRQHHKHLKSTNMLEHSDSTRKSGCQPVNRAGSSPMRLSPRPACGSSAPLAVETHENWLEAHRYLNMNDLKEHKTTQIRQAA